MALQVGGDIDTTFGAFATIGGLASGGGLYAHAVFSLFVFELACGVGLRQIGFGQRGVFIADLDLRGGFELGALLALGQLRGVFRTGCSRLAGFTFLAFALAALTFVAHLTFGDGRRRSAALALFACFVFATPTARNGR